MKLNLNFIRRQLTSSKKQASIFVLCVVLSMVTLVALTGFSESVNRALLRDARALHAADVSVRSGYEFSEPIMAQIAAFEADDLVDNARVYEFLSVVRVPTEDNSLLADLKIVEPGYPYYGQVALASGRNFHTVLQSGDIIVAQLLLDRLGITVGDSLRVGEATLTIVDVVVLEPDQPVNFFNFGPRIFISIDDLESLALVGDKSRVQYSQLLKVKDPQRVDDVAAALDALVAPDVERVETFRTAESGVKRFFDNFLFFLSLIGIFTLLLAGIGIQSALTAFLRERNNTIAVVKTMGGTRRFITSHYFAVVAILGLAGTLVGLTLGFMLQGVFPILFRSLLPPNVSLIISRRAVAESLLLGIMVVGSFTFMPLYRLEELKPSFIFRKEIIPLQKGTPYYTAAAIILLFFIGLVLWQIRDLRIGSYFVGGVLALVAISAGLAELILRLLQRTRIKPLVTRQALRGLFRPGNATRAIIITLATSLAVIFSIFLIERNLDATFIQSYPEDAPNVFFLDIQADQVDAFAETLGIETSYFPVVRGGVSEINGEKIDRVTEEERDGNNLGRQFNFTYRDELIDGETLAEGNSIFRADWEGAQVSLLDELRELRDFQVGDTMIFRIQGVPLEARVASIRKRSEENVQPFFNFVFQEAALKDLPQTIFTAVRLEKAEIAPLQNRIVARFPNISVIDVTSAIAAFSELAGKITRVIRFFTLFSIIAGVLIIISSVFATRFARIQEAVYFKVLGAKRRFVLQVFALENILLGLVSALLALFLSQVGSWLISVYAFEIDYNPFIGASLIMVVLTIMLVTAVGLLASISILQKRPIVFLREQNEG